jgi:hypothetical protein
MPDASNGRRGVALLAAVAFLTILILVAHGNMRAALIAIAIVGLAISLGYLLATWTPTKIVTQDMINHMIGWYDQGRYRTWLTNSTATAGHMSFSGIHVVLMHPDHRSLDTNRAENPMLTFPGLRCEVKRYWRRKKYLCSHLHAISSGYTTMDFPRELTQEIDGTVHIVGGSYIVRWKCDARRRVLARRTVWYDGEQYMAHPVVRILHKCQGIVQHLRGLDDAMNL